MKRRLLNPFSRLFQTFVPDSRITLLETTASSVTCRVLEVYVPMDFFGCSEREGTVTEKTCICQRVEGAVVFEYGGRIYISIDGNILPV